MPKTKRRLTNDTTLAQKLDALIRQKEQALGGKKLGVYALAEMSGGTITASYLWKLRMGTMNDPSLHILEALSRIFDVPICHFAAPFVPAADRPADSHAPAPASRLCEVIG